MSKQAGPGSENYRRVHDSAVGRWEKPLLRYIAERLPPSVTPDQLTVVGLAGAILTGLSYIATNISPLFLLLASLGLLINWFGDSLDGTLARVRNLERPRYGFFVDHTVDIFAQMAVIFGIGLSIYMRFDMACLILIGYLSVSAYTYIRMHATRVMQVSYGGFGPTELRLLTLALHCVAFAIGPAQFNAGPLGRVSAFDCAALVLFFGAVISVIAGVLTTARQLGAEDRPPVPQPGE